MKIISSAFKHNTKIPAKYTCDGENVSPPLQFLDVPSVAKSLVLIVDDPDAPSKTWVHWVIYNISPDVTEVEEDSVPEGGIEGMTDFGKPCYAAILIMGNLWVGQSIFWWACCSADKGEIKKGVFSVQRRGTFST